MYVMEDEMVAIAEARPAQPSTRPRPPRPASPIMDVYTGDDESHDQGVELDLDLASPPASPSNERHFQEMSAANVQAGGYSGVWNWFSYAKNAVDTSIVAANSYLEDNEAIQATTNRIYSVGEETHKALAQAGAYTRDQASVLGRNVASYGQFVLSSVDIVNKKDSTPLTLNLIADDHVDTDLIMLGFQNLFYTASGVKQTVASGLASQLVGPGAAIEGCRLRIQAARAQKLVPENSLAISVESFIQEIVPGSWVEQYCLLIHDPTSAVELHTFSQPINVPTSLAAKCKEATPEGYALRSSGYAKSIVEVIGETFPDVNIRDWYTPFVGISTSQVLALCANLLAVLYRQHIANPYIAETEGEVERS